MTGGDQQSQYSSSTPSCTECSRSTTSKNFNAGLIKSTGKETSSLAGDFGGRVPMICLYCKKSQHFTTNGVI